MPADDSPWAAFAEKIDAHHEWPCAFVFKCVVPQAHSATARSLLPTGEISERQSGGGKYTALTCTFHAENAGEVVALYQRLSVIEGVILL